MNNTYPSTKERLPRSRDEALCILEMWAERKDVQNMGWGWPKWRGMTPSFAEELRACVRLLKEQPSEPSPKPVEGFYVFRTEGSYNMALWWRPGRCGYTFDLKQAGIYSAEDARDIEECSHGEDYGVPVAMLSDLPVRSMIKGIDVKRWRKDQLGLTNKVIRCRYDTDHDGNCHIHPKGCPS